MTPLSLVFVHGINNSAKERAGMKPMLLDKLEKHGLRDAFQLVEVAQWRSLGNFMADILDLKTHEVRLSEAVDDVAQVIRQTALGGLAPPWKPSGMIIVGHSMGQVISNMAIHKITAEDKKMPVPTSYLTLGGPMGNASPAFRSYLSFMPSSNWSNKPEEMGCQEWCDWFNRQDPVPADVFLGYDRPLGARAMELDFPGRPPLNNPFAEHGSYFDAPAVYAELGEMAKRLRARVGG